MSISDGNTAGPIRRSGAFPLGTSRRDAWRTAWVVVGVVALAAVLFFFFRGASSVLYYLVMGMFFSFAMQPAVRPLSKRFGRGGATALVMLGVMLFLAVFIALFGSLLVAQVTAFATSIPGLLSDGIDWVNSTFDTEFNPTKALESLNITPGQVATYSSGVLGSLFGIVGSVLSTAFGAFVLLFFTFYLSTSLPTLRNYVAGMFPERRQVAVLTTFDLVQVKVGNYIAARAILATINALSTGLFMYLINMPFWLPLALWTGLVAQFIPNIGTYISIALPAAIGFLQPYHALGLYIIVWGILYQQIENLFIEPRISSRAVNVHPLVSFSSALIGASMFGLSGALLGVPLGATVVALFEIYRTRYSISEETEARVARNIAADALRGKASKQAESTEAKQPPRGHHAERPHARADHGKEAAVAVAAGGGAVAASRRTGARDGGGRRVREVSFAPPPEPHQEEVSTSFVGDGAKTDEPTESSLRPLESGAFSGRGLPRRKATESTATTTDFSLGKFARKAPAKKAAKAPSFSLAKPAKKSAAKSAAKRAAAKASTLEVTEVITPPTKKSAAKKSVAKKSAAAKAPAKKVAATKAPAEKSPAKKSPAKKSPAKKSPAKKSAAKKATATKAPAKKVAATKKAATKKAATKKRPAKKVAAKKATRGQ